MLFITWSFDIICERFELFLHPYAYCIIYQTMQGPQKVKVGSDKVVTAKEIIIATGSVPFVPKGIEVDGTFFF